MEPNQAAEQLQVIRTLMERSAIYRRALAPIMTYCGVVGIIGGLLGKILYIDSLSTFVWYWVGVAFAALLGSFYQVRRQALKDSEAFWSPPTRRIIEALLPPFVVGAFSAWGFAHLTQVPTYDVMDLLAIWCLCHGCAVHSAGFFMPRGLKLFGWLFILVGLGLFSFTHFFHDRFASVSDAIGYGLLHWFMGGIFGGLHLAYGIYLYFTEKRGMTS